MEHIEQVVGAAGKAEDMLTRVQVLTCAGDNALSTMVPMRLVNISL